MGAKVQIQQGETTRNLYVEVRSAFAEVRERANGTDSIPLGWVERAEGENGREFRAVVRGSGSTPNGIRDWRGTRREALEDLAAATGQP